MPWKYTKSQRFSHGSPPGLIAGGGGVEEALGEAGGVHEGGAEVLLPPALAVLEGGAELPTPT